MTLIVLSIIGVSLYKGEMWQCEGIDIETDISNELDCANFGGIWANIDMNFDNFFVAFLTLFQMMTTEGWMTPLF